MKHNLWRYFCITTNQLIYEERKVSDGQPITCINNPNHIIDLISVVLLKDGNKLTKLKENLELYNVENIKNNYLATSIPTNNDDSSNGYSIGSRWINVIINKEYVCVDASITNAIWIQTTNQEAINNINAINIGTGIGVFKTINNNVLEFKKLRSINNDLNIVDNILENTIDLGIQNITATNIGTTGVGILKENLQFKKLNSINNNLHITDNILENTIDLDIDIANIDILSLKNAPNSEVVGITDEQILENKTLCDPKIKTAIFDINDNKFMDISSQVSAVNYFKITNAAINQNPLITVDGLDTNIDIEIYPKGNGNIILNGLQWPNNDGNVNQILGTDGAGNLSFVTVTGSTEVNNAIITNDDSLVNLATIVTNNDEAYYLDILVIGKSIEVSYEIIYYKFNIIFKNISGILTEVAKDIIKLKENQWDIIVDILTNNILIQVIGENGKIIEWKSIYKLEKL